MPTDLHQERKILRCDRKFRQWWNRHEACQLRDMNFIGAKWDRWLESEGAARQEIDCARSPGSIRKSCLADREDIIGSVDVTGFVGEANTGIGDGRHTLAIDDGEEHSPQSIRCRI